MNLHTLSNEQGARHRAKRVGCGDGSGHGGTSTRGHKGQYARKGGKFKPGFEGGQMKLIRRIPKRGFKNPTRRHYAGLNVAALQSLADGVEVTLASLRTAGLVSGAWDGLKILGGGELSRKLTVKANAFSASARAKIEAAGGTCEVTKV